MPHKIRPVGAWARAIWWESPALFKRKKGQELRCTANSHARVIGQSQLGLRQTYLSLGTSFLFL
jgi:hypothetical protein